MLRFTDNIIMQLTKDCNLHCTYCYQGCKKQWRGKQVSFESFKTLVDTAIYYRCILGRIENPINFHFHGGEVTLLPKETLKQMVEYILSRREFFPGLSFCMQTNGLNLDEEMCRYFVEVGMPVGVSFDGFHTAERMPLEASRKLIDKLKYLHETTGCGIGFLSVLHKGNMETWFDDMQELRPWAANIGVNPIAAEDDSIIPTAEENWKYWIYPVLQTYLTDNPFRERNVEIAVQKVITDIVFETNKEKVLKTGCFDRICGHGANMIAVDPEMNQFNCDKYLEEGPFINLRKGIPLDQRDFLGMQQIKRCLHYYHKIIDLEKKTHCDKCKAKWICNGECQSYMYSKYGEYRFNESMCPIYKRSYDFIKNHWVEIAKHEIPIIGPVFSAKPEALSELEKVNKDIKFDPEKNSFKVVDR